jgi:hypothetical protein
MTTVDAIGHIKASLSQGGWEADGTVFNDADRLAWNQAVSYYFRLYRGGAWEENPRLGFSGHLNPNPYTKTFQGSIAPFRAYTAQEYLKKMRVQGIFFKYSASPGNQHEAPETYAEIVSHVIGQAGEYGHCNLSEISWPGEGFIQTDIDIANSAAHGEHLLREGTIWQRIQEIAQIENYIAYFDKFNTFHYIIRPMFGTLPDPVLDITAPLLLEPLRIIPRDTEQVGQVRIQGATPAGLQLSGVYPADPTYGPIVQETGFKASSGANITANATRRYLYENRDVTVVAALPGAIGLMLDLADRVSITYTSTADGVAWSAKKFWVEEIDVVIMDNFLAQSVLTLEAENAG